MSSATLGYGCTIDAGSSGSRIYLYRWPGDKNNAEVPLQSSSSYTKVEQEAIFSDERSVGIDGENGLDLLDELISAARAALPSDIDPSKVPIYLGATGGMRMHSDNEHAKNTTTIMIRIRSLLHASGFLFHDEWARMISGDEESVYGWLVANYLKNRSLPNYNEKSLETYGALDLGGASTQISSLVSSSTRTTATTTATLANENNDGTLPLRIGTVEYVLYTRSYLYYGADQARNRHDIQFAEMKKVNPCYPDGYTNTDTNISGSSNWDECFDSVAKLFDQHSSLRGGQEHALLDVIVPPPINVDNAQQQRYIAMSVFVFIWDFLGLQTGTETEDLNTLKDRAQNVCNLTHMQQMEQYNLTMKNKPPGRKTNKPFAQCFNAAYAYHLMSKGYNMPVVDTPVEVYYEINGAKVNWALGLMLVEANKLNYGTNINSGVKGQLGNYMHNSGTGNTAKHAFLVMSLVVIFWMFLMRFIGAGRMRFPLCCIMSKQKK